MKKLIYIAPLALTMILSSCGSKEAGDDKKEEEKKDRTACDCMQILLDEMKKSNDPSQIQAIQEELDKQYPDCEKLVEGMKAEYGSPDKAAEACPAVGELMELMNAQMEEAAANMNDTLGVPTEEPAAE